MDKYWIWFKLLDLSHNNKIELLYKYKDIEKIFNNLYTKHNKALLINAEQINQYNKDNNIKILNILDNKYPFLLKNIFNPPILFYYTGQIKILNSKCITIFLGKNIDEYGINLTKYVCKQLTLDGYKIVSRFENVDKYIYENVDDSIIVLPNGIKKNTMDKKGIILTEHEYYIKNSKKNILQRNRILTGLSIETLIIQGLNTDGIFYIVDTALEQGRQISVFPGNIFNHNNFYTNNLIIEGAKPINSFKDLLVYEQEKFF